ncbi:hypothetical protein amrb99_35230 [Actinomadura sp. RB99]|nr:hypothetical protein [Actinomadura sp. RB99]MBD2894597.1 hypothetical protein [Actinomadura sp. RB99]
MTERAAVNVAEIIGRLRGEGRYAYKIVLLTNYTTDYGDEG